MFWPIQEICLLKIEYFHALENKGWHITVCCRTCQQHRPTCKFLFKFKKCPYYNYLWTIFLMHMLCIHFIVSLYLDRTTMYYTIRENILIGLQVLKIYITYTYCTLCQKKEFPNGFDRCIPSNNFSCIACCVVSLKGMIFRVICS